MPMSPRLLRPRAGGVTGDSDVRNYIGAVEAADGQPLEQAVKDAIRDFILGCKTDNIWSAIKASCILMGARTLSGALTPLVGSAPTNNGPFVSADYNRKTGLLGNGTSKYLALNRLENDDLQNSVHNAAYVSAHSGFVIGTNNSASAGWVTISNAATRSRSTTADLFTAVDGFLGHSRSSSASYVRRNDGTSTTLSRTSGAPGGNAYELMRTAGVTTFGSPRVAYYSVGSHLDLALLDSRVTTLYNAIGAAI